jgi:hypothetical protein
MNPHIIISPCDSTSGSPVYGSPTATDSHDVGQGYYTYYITAYPKESDSEYDYWQDIDRAERRERYFRDFITPAPLLPLMTRCPIRYFSGFV